MITVCIPVLNSYDTLYKSIETIGQSVLDGPHLIEIVVLDNGGRFDINYLRPNLTLIKNSYNIGVAASWNWFAKNIKEIRLICNDDIFFYPESINNLVKEYDENRIVFPLTVENLNAFSCFILPDKITSEVGLFDEDISPQYGYFEDNDYHRRLQLAGYDIKGVQTKVAHRGSSTLRNLSPAEEKSHHEKFKVARNNYIKKWGGEPGKERYTTPYNGTR